jgi:hypothetical protein|tara:strand:- start:79 stop:417 length:339 start_codon:yes stop_codon:yes gene_type:complete
MIFGHSNNLNRIMSFTVKSNNPNLIYPCFLAIGLLSLYLTTMPDFATLEDSGLFIAVAHEPGIAHPPGYPLYTILAHLLAWIPLGTVAKGFKLSVHLLASQHVFCFSKFVKN